MIRQLRDELPATYDAGDEQVIRISRGLSQHDIERIADAVAARMGATDPEMLRPLKPAEAAEWLGIDRATLSLWTTEGRVPHVRMGERQPRYIRADLLVHLRKTGEPQP